jgi:ATP-dependent DNA ligase
LGGYRSKNAQAPYRSDRNEAWLKIKTLQKGKFSVIGFVKDLTGVAALYRGKREGKDLVYMGKDRLVADGFKPDQETTRCGGQPQIQTDQSRP